MSARSVIDSLRFAETSGRMSGEYGLLELERLHDLLVTREGALQWALSGVHLAGRPALRVEVRGELTLVCQRCLGPHAFRLEIDTILPVARDESELARWEQEDPLQDALVADPRLDVLDLIEDEVLLSLPVVPMHPPGECGQAGVQTLA